MVMDAVIERFMEQSPVTVTARLALQRAWEPAWVAALFEQKRREQSKVELLFSAAVELMTVVAVGQRPSLHAAAKASQALKSTNQPLTGIGSGKPRDPELAKLPQIVQKMNDLFEGDLTENDLLWRTMWAAR